ncbi:glycosyltransferase family 2 protein [Thauera humireducens]|uniref:Glycosyltransferase 2-like domain-containing protein n=1 Tax=Thauera humireducens TaxID=1134435 RepID=A0A127K677_9RHOO|nr:glycosyltransferase [Thauera humireducens]AMO37462.1 hypothetical protein AC731_011230 [Thauera humireducens]
MSQVVPKVSVIMPAFNVKAFIAEAINSVFLQDVPGVEILVIDDGSRDGTADFVEQNFPVVRLFRKENGGSATARNVGLREARGEYIAFLDADDVWLPGKLKAQLDYFEAHPDIAMLGTGFAPWVADADGRFGDPAALAAGNAAIDPAAVDPDASGWGYHKMLLDNYVWTTTVMMRRALVERIGLFDETLRLGQDYDFFLRASRETEIHVLKRVFAVYRQHPGSAIARGADFNYAAHIIRRATGRWGLSSPNGESITPQQLSARLQHIHFSCGYRHYGKSLYDKALSEFLASAREKPTHLRSWAYAALSWLQSLKGARA